MKSFQKNWLEWTVFGFGSILVTGVLVFLLYEALTYTPQPAVLAVELGAPQQVVDRYIIPFTVKNSGGETATDVQVEVALERPDQPLEQVHVAIDVIPRYSSGEGWVAFRSDPGTGDLHAHVQSFRQP